MLTSGKFLSEGDGNKRELQRQVYLTLVKQADRYGAKRANLAIVKRQQYRHGAHPMKLHQFNAEC